MHRLLTEDTPENRARAFSVYHLVVEGIFAQTGYFALHTAYSEKHEETPTLPGLVEGLFRIRGDEGRHVGFGMAKLRELVQAGGVDPGLLSETVAELVGLVQGSLEAGQVDEDELSTSLDLDLAGYAMDKHAERMAQITDASAEMPDVEGLTRIEGD